MPVNASKAAVRMELAAIVMLPVPAPDNLHTPLVAANRREGSISLVMYSLVFVTEHKTGGRDR